MREYLTDSKFLSMLDEMRIKKHYAKITVLSFVDEKPLREIQGIATAGSITVNGQAALRRTISLTVSGVENENDINNIENIISINKKVKIEVGLENPFEDYKNYGDIIWFPLGTYVINQATTSTTASSANISISGKDKMCMLDGTCGGTLPSAVTFHETQYEDENGDITIEQVPIFTIIKECVTHFGKEPEQNVIINDVDMTAKLSTKYVGQNPIWFSKDYKSFVISENAPKDENFLQHKFIYGQDVGYQETDFTYPGELVFSAGDTVTSVLDKIIESLGNYEYFYDLDGHFVFQQKKNYLNYYYTPITQINDNYYIKAFSDSKYYYTFINAKDALSYYNSPKYENIKNDFIVWGDKTNANGVTKTIQYHLAIDEKPQIDLANQYMWDITRGNGDHAYYLFEYEKNDYNQTPEQKAIEIIYTENHSEITDSSIETAIKKDVVNNILQNYSFYNGDQFILFYKVIFPDQVRYYKVVLLNKEIIDFIYLEDLTDIIDFTHLAFGVYPKKDEEEDESSGDNNSSGDDPIGYPDRPNSPDLDPGFGIPDSWHSDIYPKSKQDQLDPDFNVIPRKNTPSDPKKDSSSSETNNKKGSDLLLPFLDPVEGKKDQLKVLKDQEDVIKKIFILRDNGNYTLNEIIEEITNAYNSNIIDFSILPENSKIKIVTYVPEEPKFDYEDNFYFTLIGTPCHEWREELFRQALLNNENGSQKGDYDDELLAKINNEYLWRKQLFDPQNETWHEEWNNQIDSTNSDEEKIDTWDGWNPAIYIDPSLVTYWLDFIDVDQLVSKYSVNKIGRRTKALTKTNMSLLYKLDVPDIIFFENTGEADLIQKIEEYTLEGQAYCALKPGQMKLFSSSGTGSTAFDYIREMLYQYLIYNLTVTINCAPRYYLEPNNLIYIDDKKSNIKGEFVITQYTLPLTYNGNMSITTNEALTRV